MVQHLQEWDEPRMVDTRRKYRIICTCGAYATKWSPDPNDARKAWGHHAHAKINAS